MRNASLLSLSILLGGCSLIATFDRNRIGDGGGMDAGVDAQIPEGGVGVPGSNAGCANDSLCCDEGGALTCVATGSSQCGECGVPCDTAAADSCVDRVCQCGTNPACEGATPFCDATAGECVGCRTDGDCAGMECVDGTCRECDPADFSGCSGATPICNASFVCEACSDSPNNCRGGLMCDPTTGCGCTNDDQCLDATPTTPICNNGSDLCEGCTMDNDCSSAHPSLPICNETTGSCNECEVGSTSCPAATPICREMAGIARCAACTADVDCTGRAGASVCAESGSNMGECVECDANDASACAGGVCDTTTNTCVECAGATECADTPTTPICTGGSCVACSADAQCNAITAGDVCVTMGPRTGACGDCDPTDSACTGMTPICDPATTMCEACGSGAECVARGGNTPICDGDGSCRACTAGDCVGTTPICNAATGACVECTVLTQDTDCMGDQVCHATMLRCVDCDDAGDCGGMSSPFTCNASGQCICMTPGGGPGDNCTCSADTPAFCAAGERCNRATNLCETP